MSDKSKNPTFTVGAAAKREVKRALVRSTNPAETIANFQKQRSLHSMFSRAFGTTPQYEKKEQSSDNSNAETLDTDSVLAFLAHLGVNQYEVHKRIADALQKQIEDEIRKGTSQEALLNLLKSCWHHATMVPELRPILWAVLKKLGDKTPLAVLNALGERGDDGKLKHAEIFRPLPPLLKRLVWEADWGDKVTIAKEQSTDNPKQYLKLVQSTLLYETVHPIVEKYCSTEFLQESASKFFVPSALERRVLTTQRRALAATATATSVAATSSSSSTAATLLSKSAGGGGGGASGTNSSSEPLLSSGKAVSQLRQLLGDATGGSAGYRPKLLHAVLSVLMARHGSQAPKLLTAPHLHCTLVGDILLSTSGPLPKVYQHVHTLASTLDDAVRNGVFSDDDLVKVQATLKAVYDEEHSEAEMKDGDGGGKSKKSSKKEDDAKDGSNPQPSTFLKRQLNRIITAALTAMKDSDPQNLFLNPVTDAIAPGYSKVIKTPMCISTMEAKIEQNEYNSIQDWDSDVRLMFKNCVDYNRGQAGQWFRGEANRQLKVFKDEVLPQAKKLYKVELQRRNPVADMSKRQREEDDKASKVRPLEPANKKRKPDVGESTLSMPAVAAMLLADPFVVRLLLDRVLRSLRIDVLRGTTLPATHSVVPSILQLLHMAQWSTQICALRGNRYVVPDSGMKEPDDDDAVEAVIPFSSLRRYLPIVVQLLLEADLDKRVAVGGDLHAVADSLPRPEAPSIALEKGTPPLQVTIALLEGLFVHVCLPGNSQDASLSVTFPKFAQTLQDLAGNLWEEEAFFKCLIPSILRHKARLNRTTRDTIISTWMKWLMAPSETSKKKKRKNGSMTSAAHEYMVMLVFEWASLGNLLMPRDLLLDTSTEMVQAVNKTEPQEQRQFATLWEKSSAEEDNDPTTVKEFEKIKTQYERILSLLPESHSMKWKRAVGIVKEPGDKNDEGKEESEQADEAMPDADGE